MELRLLRTFMSVAELRHFAKAADACNLSQLAVSHQIALLEEDVGARLFNRTGRRVTMTVAGEVLLEEARRVLGAVDRARERMNGRDASCERLLGYQSGRTDRTAKRQTVALSEAPQILRTLASN